jgi:lipoate-protein ligase A
MPMIVPSSTSDRQKLDKAIRECVDSLTRVESEKDFRKEVADMIKEELEIKPADFNNMVKESFNKALSDKIEKYQDVIDSLDLLKNVNSDKSDSQDEE